MTPGLEQAIMAAKAARTTYPLLRGIARRFRSIRRRGAIGLFPELRAAGLISSYRDRDHALADIIASIDKSACSSNSEGTLRILSNKGDDWLGDTGRLGDALRIIRGHQKRLNVETLLMHLQAPWINDYKGGYSGKDREKVREDFCLAHESVARFCSEMGLAAPRFHKGAAIWRFVMTDFDVFVTTYSNKQHVPAEPVLQFSNESLIYRSLRVHFDYMYDALSAVSGELNEFEHLANKRVHFKESAGLVCTRIEAGRREALVIRKGRKIVLPKGGYEREEMAFETAARELTEETGYQTEAVAERLVGVYVTGQPFFSSVDVKAIAYFHVENARMTKLRDVEGVRWADDNYLAGASFAYDHIPEVLRKCGMHV
jgi:8-oxo-dGTP pyrophosphatase MutT (NUDIX family)